MCEVLKNILFFLFLALLSSSCAFNQNTKDKTLVRLGFMPNVTHATTLVGIEKEIFQKEIGDKFSLIPIHFLVGNSIIDAFITNQIDIAYVGPGPFLNAIYRKVPLKLIAGAANGGTLIVGAVPVSAAKRIAIPQYGNTQDLILKLYLEKRNKDLANVKTFAVPPQDINTAFFTMSIDAACLPEPWGTILVERNVCMILEDEKTVLNNGDYPVTVLVVSKKFAEQNPLAVSGFLKAHEITTAFINENQEESIDIVTNAISKISKKQMKRDFIATSFKRCSFTRSINLNILKEFEAIGIKARYYKKGFLDESHIN